MSDLLQTRLQHLKSPNGLALLSQVQRGIEKEGLRVTPKALIAQTGHPEALGSTLTHKSITTDYSEALLEFITPVCQQVDDTIDYLSDLHHFTLRHMPDEYLWPASMPCRLEGEASIPIAQYGSANIGQMKHVYRQGLSYRYGRTMQAIAGIHYNFSMPDNFWPYCQQVWGEQGDVQAFKSQRYFDLIRNFRRHSWLLVYLFGASPTLDNSFMGDKKTDKLDTFSKNTLGLPFATSLRMSDLGYQSEAQANLNVSYNNLDNYVDDVTKAIAQGYPAYEKIGINVDGSYRQLNSNVLQIENEYYSEIRPKRVTQSGEQPIVALKERGVEYIEVRILDTNPFLPVGIDAQQIRFLDVFLLYCLLSESAALSVTESDEIKANQQRVVREGRNPKLMLTKNGQPVAFKKAANGLLTQLQPIADLLDKAHEGQSTDAINDKSQTHSQALIEQIAKVGNSELTPSAMMMAAGENGDEFIDLMLAQAKLHQTYFSERGLSSAMEAQLQRETIESIQQQKLLEASDVISFEQFLAQQNAR